MSERSISMSEQEQLFKVLLEELQGLKTNLATELHGIKSNMATKKDIELVNSKLDKLSGKIDAQHIENINADNRLLNEIQELKEGVLFVNRKIADAELEINLIKHKKQ
jgi:gas vesicle protein